MARLQVVITNNESDPITLPRELDRSESEIAASGSKTLDVDTTNWDRHAHNLKPSWLLALEALNDRYSLTVTVDTVEDDEFSTSLAELVFGAVTRSEFRNKGLRAGTDTVADGNTSVTVEFANDLPDTDYQVIVTPLTTEATATEFFVNNKTVDGFDINVDSDPGADVDFDWVAIRL